MGLISFRCTSEFLSVITQLDERIWIPYQVGLEFNRNRLNVLSEQRKNYKEFQEKILSLIKEIDNKNRNPFFSKELISKVFEVKETLEKETLTKLNFYEKSFTSDKILEQVNKIFNNKVGTEFSEKNLINIYREGEKRYKNKIPPGFRDAKKSEPEKYGDLLVWKEIIQEAKKLKKEVIFVLDDRKDDWWLQHDGKTISPRPELLKEFKIEVNKNIHFYKPFQFLEYSNKYLKTAISKEIIEEVKEYKKQSRPTSDFLEINYVLKGKFDDFYLLKNDIKDAGYNILVESDENSDIHYLTVILPNFPDLKRRFDKKYISNLSSYNISLLNFKKL